MTKHSTAWVKKWLQRNRMTASDMRNALLHYKGSYYKTDCEVIEELRNYSAIELRYIASY